MGSPAIVFSGLDAGGLLDDFDPPSVAALTPRRGFRPAISAAHDALTSAAASVSPLDSRPASFALSQPRALVPESGTPTCVFSPVPRSQDGIL